MKAWTDYPIAELGDAEGKEAPVRQCDVTAWDRDKYCTVVVDGVTTSFKRGYLYQAQGRCGEVPQLTRRQLYHLPLR